MFKFRFSYFLLFLIILFIFTSISLHENIMVFSFLKNNNSFILDNISQAQQLARDLGFEIPTQPLIIINCSKFLAKLPMLHTYGGHYLPLLNTVFIYQTTPNNIYHEYFHYIQDSQYHLDFKDGSSYWILESSARWFENYTLEHLVQRFDFTKSLFETNYTLRYERWMLFKRLIAYDSQAISTIFKGLSIGSDPCYTLNNLPYFHSAVIDLIKDDFQANFKKHYAKNLTRKTRLSIQPFQLDFALVDGNVYVNQHEKIYYISFDKDLSIIMPQKTDGGDYYPYCYILAIINFCDQEQTIKIYDYEDYYFTYVEPN